MKLSWNPFTLRKQLREAYSKNAQYALEIEGRKAKSNALEQEIRSLKQQLTRTSEQLTQKEQEFAAALVASRVSRKEKRHHRHQRGKR